MPKNLVIVESPAKAKTIEKYLGSDYKVLSSMGHIRDLPKSGIGVDIEHNFEPEYEISPDKTKTVAELKRAAKGNTVWLATDEDREGEAISWHLCNALGLNDKTTKRIVFHEITREAITEAVKNPRVIDLNLVDAQQARRVLDRLVGYELSPVLWKKIRTGLSAGRVQSVAVRLIVEREREIEAFEQKSDYKITAEFKTKKGEILKAELNTRLADQKSAEAWLKKVADQEFTVADITKKPSKRSPAAPFTTSTLQQAASSRLGYSVRQTMVLAQKLYEAGHITYMRTDSVNLSNQALTQAKQVIEKDFGPEYYQSRVYKSRTANAQEAHEAIRPTNFALDKAGADTAQAKLYQLIRARAMGSQMSDAKLEKTEITINTKAVKEHFIAKGEIVVFAGFLRAYPKSTGQDDTILPDISSGDQLQTQQILATQTYARPPARYNEASLVRELEKRGIGRPSTYAPTISTIQTREYVTKSEGMEKTRPVTELALTNKKITTEQRDEGYDTDANRLRPTDTGTVVTDFLLKYFTDIMDYNFTADVEAEFDQIAAGKQEWHKMIKSFYGPFHKLIAGSEDITRHEASQGRVLGKDPKSGKPVIARLGRYGAMLQIGEATDEQKPKFAPMPAGRKINDVTLEEALEMFKLPRVVGKTSEGEEITANIGRFGPYVKVGDSFVSIKDGDPFSIKETEARELIVAKRKADAAKLIQDFEIEKIQVLNGRYGPYVTDGSTNAKVPKDQDPKKLSLKQCQELLEQARQNPGRGRRFAPRANKKTSK
jgi:DNA topoisomerase-1